MEEENVQDWIFTFGANHIWPLTGRPMLKNYVVLRGTYEGTRREMHYRFGDRWAQQYPSKEAAGVERFRLTEIKLEEIGTCL